MKHFNRSEIEKPYLIEKFLTLALFAVFMVFFTFGCVSAPERGENEEEICFNAKYTAYVFKKHDKVPETVLSQQFQNCNRVLIYSYCDKWAKSNTNENRNEKDLFQSCWEKIN